MSFLYQSGEGLNLLQRAAAVKAPTVAGTFDPNFPVSALYDGRPTVYAQLQTLVAFASVTFDLNLLPGGDGEAALDSGWVASSDTGTPTVSIDATVPYSGTGSIRIELNVASGTHWAMTQRELRFRAGEKLRLYHAGRIGVGTSVVIIVQNMETGLYLTSAGAWATAGQAAGTHDTPATWTDGYVTFVMPAAAGGGLWQRLNIQLKGIVAAGPTIDARVEAKIVPGWDTVVLLGHTMTPAVKPVLAYSPLAANNPGDAWTGDSYPTSWLKTTSAGETIVADELDQQAVWNATMTRYERWVRFYLTRTTWNPECAVGELILCQTETLARNPRMQLGVSHQSTGQIRVPSGAGDQWIYNRAPIVPRKITLRYESFSPMDTGVDAMERAARMLHVTRTHGGRWPTLVIPYEHDPQAVFYGHFTGEFVAPHEPPSRTYEVTIDELPIPGLHHTLGTM